MKELDLNSRYGKDSWAVITGASHGLGWGFAQGLASRGFNVLLIARNKDLLQERVQKLYEMQKNPNSKDKKYDFVVADFEQHLTAESYHKLVQQFEDKDVSVLVNNVGARLGAIESGTLAQARTCAIVNTIPCAMLTRLFVDKLESRSKNSAIINVSSLNSLTPTPGRCLYAATKAFNTYFTTNISDSFGQNKIDWLNLLPAFISTPTLGNRPIDLFTTDIQTCTDEALKCLGNVTISYGAVKHKILG